MQRGNAVLSVLLGLLLTAIVAGVTLQARRMEQRRSAGAAEATILEGLRNAVNAAIFEQVVSLQAGNALTRNGVSASPSLVGGELVWSPTPAQLAGMTYLPAGWTTTSSSLNGAPYSVSFKRTPSGCLPANCSIEGYVLLGGALLDGPSSVDGVVIGSILSRIGADSGVSLVMAPGTITGFANSWSTSNPVAGTPAGVVAVRVGTASAGFSQFVRISDTRDPNLAGSLTVAGALSVGGAATLRNTTTISGAALNINASDGTNCVQVLPTGVVRIKCSGALEMLTATADDGAGNRSAISPGSISTTGAVTAGGNVVASGSVAGDRLRPTGSYVPGSACGAANEVAANALVTGLLLCTGGAWRPVVTQAAAGQACSPEGTLAQADGAALLCRGGTYVALTSFLRRGAAGQACSDIAATATDLATGATILCRPNPAGGAAMWYRVNDLTSNLQWIASVEAVDGQVIAKPPCGFSAGYTGQAAIVLTPMAEGSTDASFSRFAVDNGGSWTVFLRDSAGGVLQGSSASGSASALAQQYCYYP